MKPGRPRLKPEACRCHQRAVDIINDITFLLDAVMVGYYSTLVPQTSHYLENAMRTRLRHEMTRLQEIEKRLLELAAVYNEFQDLREEAQKRKSRIGRLIGLIGANSEDVAWVNHVAKESIQREPEDLRADLPLWEAMREYLSYAREARIAEMEEFFSAVGFAEGNRQAIESALKRHPSVFKTRKKKREKFISLKGA